MRLIDIALTRMRRPAGIAAVGLGLLFLLATASLAVRAAEQPAPKTFASPHEAAAALAEAWGHEDKEALLKIFGPGAANLINSGDPIADDNASSSWPANTTPAIRSNTKATPRRC